MSTVDIDESTEVLPPYEGEKPLYAIQVQDPTAPKFRHAPATPRLSRADRGESAVALREHHRIMATARVVRGAITTAIIEAFTRTPELRDMTVAQLVRLITGEEQ